jgi:hypothetical protein
MERKQQIGDKEYTFEFTNMSFIKLDEKFEKAGEIFNGVLEGKKHISNSIKMLCVSCKEREFSPEEIVNEANPSEFLKLPSLANDLVLDYFGTKKNDGNNIQDGSKNNKKK